MCLCCVLQGLEFIADNKEEQSRTLLGNVASVNDELQGIVASLHTGEVLLPLLPPGVLPLSAGSGFWQRLHNTAMLIACFMQPACCP
jgi:hypothetical protein